MLNASTLCQKQQWLWQSAVPSAALDDAKSCEIQPILLCKGCSPANDANGEPRAVLKLACDIAGLHMTWFLGCSSSGSPHMQVKTAEPSQTHLGFLRRLDYM